MEYVFVLVALFFCVTLFPFYIWAQAMPIAGDVDLSGGFDPVDVQLVINGALSLPAHSVNRSRE